MWKLHEGVFIFEWVRGVDGGGRVEWRGEAGWRRTVNDGRGGFGAFEGGGGGGMEFGEEVGKGETEGEAVVGAAEGLTGAGEVVGEEEGAEGVFGEGSL